MRYYRRCFASSWLSLRAIDMSASLLGLRRFFSTSWSSPVRSSSASFLCCSLARALDFVAFVCVSLPGAFVRVLRQLLCRRDASGRQPIALVASTIRNPSTYAAFEKQLVAHESPLHVVPLPSIEVPSLLDYRRDTHRICWISASPPEQLPL